MDVIGRKFTTLLAPRAAQHFGDAFVTAFVNRQPSDVLKQLERTVVEETAALKHDDRHELVSVHHGHGHARGYAGDHGAGIARRSGAADDNGQGVNGRKRRNSRGKATGNGGGANDRSNLRMALSAVSVRGNGGGLLGGTEEEPDEEERGAVSITEANTVFCVDKFGSLFVAKMLLKEVPGEEGGMTVLAMFKPVK